MVIFAPRTYVTHTACKLYTISDLVIEISTIWRYRRVFVLRAVMALGTVELKGGSVFEFVVLCAPSVQGFFRDFLELVPNKHQLNSVPIGLLEHCLELQGLVLMYKDQFNDSIFSHARDIKIFDLELLTQVVYFRHLSAVAYSMNNQFRCGCCPRSIFMNLLNLLYLLHFYNII